MASSSKRKSQVNLHRTGSITDFFTALRPTGGNEVPDKHAKHQKLKRSRKADGADGSMKHNVFSTANVIAGTSLDVTVNKAQKKDYVGTVSPVTKIGLPPLFNCQLKCHRNNSSHNLPSCSSGEPKDKECTKSISSKHISAKSIRPLSRTLSRGRTSQHVEVETVDADLLHAHGLEKQKLHLPLSKSTQSHSYMSCHQGIHLPHKCQSEVIQILKRNHQLENAERLDGDGHQLATWRALQPGGHVLQNTNDNLLWRLSWPACPLLRHLRGLMHVCFSSASYRSHCDLITQSNTQTDKQMARRNHSLKPQRSGWREDLPEDVLEQLLEELKLANPLFPVQKLFTALSKKRSKHEETWVNQELKKNTHIVGMADHRLRGKRKWMVEGPGQGISPKRRRPNQRPEENATVDPGSPTGLPLVISDHTPRRQACRSRLSRTRRRRRQGKNASPSLASNVTVSLQDIGKSDTENTAQQFNKKECIREDVLWTEKYQPSHSSEVIGNAAGVKRLQKWLKEWKLRADKEECRRRKEEIRRGKNKESWDSGDFEGEVVVEDCETELCNAVLIAGPHGIGKSTAVYACAQELGFKVFEVNASSQRSGRLLLTQLKEATQSHQVGSSTAAASKPTYFTSHTTAGSSIKPASSSLTGKTNLSSKVTTSTRRLPSAPRNKSAHKRENCVDLTHFFQKRNKPEHKPQSSPNHFKHGGHSGEPDDYEKNTETGFPMKQEIDDEDNNPSLSRTGRSTLMSLILFEEVDVIFSEDVGFLSAIKTFMSTTKRPVVLTTTDPLFGGTFDGCLEELHFKKPSVEVVCSYLRLVCLAEGVRTDPRDIRSLWAVTGGDIRQGLLQLQFWVRSGGGLGAPPLPYHPVTPQGRPCVKTPQAQEESVERLKQPTDLPACDGVCPGTPQEVLDTWAVQKLARMFKVPSVHSWTMPEHSRCLEVLSESQRRGINLLYLNMESLLPLPTATSPNLRGDYLKVSKSEPCEDTEVKKLQEPSSCSKDPDKLPGGREASKQRKGRCLSLKGTQRSKLDLKQNVSSSHQPKDTQCHRIHQSEVKTERHKAEKKPSSLVSDCLDSLTGFLDDLSFMDCWLQDKHVNRNGQHGPPGLPLVSFGAEMREGMLDELGEEQEEDEMCWHRSAEMRAAVEGRSFRGCCMEMDQAMARAQDLGEEVGADQWKQMLEQLTIPPPPDSDGILWGQPNRSETSAIEKRTDIIKTILSSKEFNRLGSTRAVITDYLPCLRTICKSESRQDQGRTRHRQPHYLRRIQSGLSRSTLLLLSNAFP
ncbi:hypothetical protein ACEWY4_018189 [Coilia grayii]|uniref:ATPase AAA-type core domain-containing protein n=1 Tax=Coilia grayii TaxID=363190 RepID=A0ABD1JKD0_9TELE